MPAMYACKPGRRESVTNGRRSLVLKITCARMLARVWGMVSFVPPFQGWLLFFDPFPQGVALGFLVSPLWGRRPARDFRRRIKGGRRSQFSWRYLSHVNGICHHPHYPPNDAGSLTSPLLKST